MSDRPRVVFERSASMEEREMASVVLDDDNVVIMDRQGFAGRKATPSEIEAARDARAERGKRKR